MSGPAKLDALTEKERACLEGVLQRKTSKEIAIDLGISPFTVDQRLNTARRKLGVARRIDAADAYARLKTGIKAFACDETSSGIISKIRPIFQFDEGNNISERSTYDALDIASPAEKLLTDVASTEDRQLHFSEPPRATNSASDGPLSPRLFQLEADHRALISSLMLMCGFAVLIMMMILIAVAAAHAMTRIFHLS